MTQKRQARQIKQNINNKLSNSSLKIQEMSEFQTQYQIEIDQNCKYPFNRIKVHCEHTSVKLMLPFLNNLTTHTCIAKIMQISHPMFIRCAKVVESIPKSSFTLIYEYVPYSIYDPSPGFQQTLKSGKYKSLLRDLFTKMLSLGIRPVVKNQNFGYDHHFQIRMFIMPNFQLVKIQEDCLVKEAEGLVVECEKMLDNCPNGVKFIKKMTDLSEKIKKMQTQFITKPKREKDDDVNKSENSDEHTKTGGNQKIGNAQWRFDPDFNFETASIESSTYTKKRRSASFKEGSAKSTKQKKTSWEASMRDSNEESEKTQVLKKRISQALVKTKQALTKYEKLRNSIDRKTTRIQ